MRWGACISANDRAGATEAYANLTMSLLRFVRIITQEAGFLRGTVNKGCRSVFASHYRAGNAQAELRRLRSGRTLSYDSSRVSTDGMRCG